MRRREEDQPPEQQPQQVEDQEIVARARLLEEKEKRGKVKPAKHKIDQTTTVSKIDDNGRLIGWGGPQIMTDEKAVEAGWPHSTSKHSTFSYDDYLREKQAEKGEENGCG